MDVEHEINSLAGETLAVQTILRILLRHLALSGNLKMVESVFDEAANDVEAFAIAVGRHAAPAHTVGAVKIVEQLRELALEK